MAVFMFRIFGVVGGIFYIDFWTSSIVDGGGGGAGNNDNDE